MYIDIYTITQRFIRWVFEASNLDLQSGKMWWSRAFGWVAHGLYGQINLDIQSFITGVVNPHVSNAISAAPSVYTWCTSREYTHSLQSIHQCILTITPRFLQIYTLIFIRHTFEKSFLKSEKI